MIEHTTRVVVVGAGYAGLLAAVRLAHKTRKLDRQITLVNPRETFVERLRLHQFAANQPVQWRPIADALRGTGVQFLRAQVLSMATASREVVAESETGLERLSYDYVLYAAGSTIDTSSVPGAGEHAYTLSPGGSRSAEALRRALPDVSRRGGQLIVVGGGPTGIEAAAEMAESYPGLRVSLVTRGELGGQWGGPIQAHIVKTLGRLGVVIRDHTAAARVEASAIVTDQGERLPFDVCLWAGGFAVPALAREAGLAVNGRGQVLIDPYMRSISHPEIFAAGDSAQPVAEAGMPVRMAALTATITGAHAADSLSATLRGVPPQPLDFAYLGQGIALGRHDAVGFNNFPDDQPTAPIFTGWLGVNGREFFVKVLASLPAIERKLPGMHFWVGRGFLKSLWGRGNRLEQPARGHGRA